MGKSINGADAVEYGLTAAQFLHRVGSSKYQRTLIRLIKGAVFVRAISGIGQINNRGCIHNTIHISLLDIEDQLANLLANEVIRIHQPALYAVVENVGELPKQMRSHNSSVRFWYIHE